MGLVFSMNSIGETKAFDENMSELKNKLDEMLAKVKNMDKEDVKETCKGIKGGMTMGFYEDIAKGLLEAIEMEKGEIPLVERKNMPAPTYMVVNAEHKLIDEMVRIRKKQNISQSEVAKLIGVKQQAISRLEKKENSPSLKLFFSIVDALGYELKIEKK